VPESGALQVPALVLFELLYVAVIVAVPVAAPVAEKLPELCPIGMVTDAGTEIRPLSELDRLTTDEVIAALVRLTVSGNVPPTGTVKDEGLIELTVGFAGVLPSVVNWIVGFNSRLLLFRVPLVR